MGSKNFAVGCDMGATKIISCVVDSDGKVGYECRFPTEAAVGPEKVGGNLISAIKETLSNCKDKNIFGIGIGTPGQINFETGEVLGSAPNIPGWTGVNVKELIESEFDYPCVVDNDVNAAIWGEFLYGAGKGCKDIVGITLGTGIGGAVIADGKLYRGSKFCGGELGHISLKYDGIPCRCGGIGCFEEYCSSRGIKRMAISKLKSKKRSLLVSMVEGDLKKITSELVTQAYHKGDEIAKAVIRETGRLTGYALSIIINILNPEKIIIGGGIATIGDFLFNAIRDGAKERSLPVPYSQVSIVPAKLGVMAGAIGAGSLILKGAQ